MAKKLEELTPKSRETDWSKAIASHLPGARTEVRTIYDARADIVTDLYVCEVERAYKHFESIGQSLLYSVALGRKPAVILLVTDKDAEQIHLGRCAVACAAAGITFTWIDMNDPARNIQDLRHILCGWRSELESLPVEQKHAIEGTLMALTAGKSIG